MASFFSADDRVRFAGDAAIVRESAFFDREYYLSIAGDPAAEDDPALHYILRGEAAGLRSSSAFCPRTYLRLNPDLRGAEMSLLVHYELHGKPEGRAISYQSERVFLDTSRLDPGKPTVVLLLHAATYSGAPILGWNLVRELKLTRNVVVVLRKGGALRDALQEYATAIVEPDGTHITDNPYELERLAERLVETFHPVYAIANSVETRLFATALRGQDVPIVALVHEFATHSPPYGLTAFYKTSDALVFPARVVWESSFNEYEIIAQRHTFIQPQGASDIPRLKEGVRIEDEGAAPKAGEVRLEDLLADPEPPFTVVGLGAIDLRKGVDLFVAAATALANKYPDVDFRFIWLGERVHEKRHQYHVFLDEQVARSGLSGRLYLFPAVDDLEPVYKAADALFISSRLDPLPNIGIDAALRHVPLLCFEEATGFADLLKQDEATAWLVAPHLDIGAVADSVARLATDADAYAAAARATNRMGRTHFNMMRYVRRLDEMGHAAARRLASIESQVATLMPADAFNAEFYMGIKDAGALSREEAIRSYLAETVNVNFAGNAAYGEHQKRALEGFNPFIYGRSAPGFKADAGVNPLVHFVREGKPHGPWKHDIIPLSRSMTSPKLGGKQQPTVALHGHFHYLDNYPEFLEALSVNMAKVDLFLTTTSDESAEALSRLSKDYNAGSVSISVLNNLGRDIRPFVKLLEGPLSKYEIVGHVHGKRSVHTFDYDTDLGNRWRVFLWQHLIGSAAPAIDVIVRHFIDKPETGFVFPENHYMAGWELNRRYAADLAPRLGLAELPEHLEFPVGTMFWARPKALAGLVRAAFTDADYPAEPLPIDGTMLHALERLLSVVVENEGYRIATTYFPEFTR